MSLPSQIHAPGVGIVIRRGVSDDNISRLRALGLRVQGSRVQGSGMVPPCQAGLNATGTSC